MSQAGIIKTSGGGGGVTSVTGMNGVTADPTTGDVVVSGVNATTASVGVASFNSADFTVSMAGEVSLISPPFMPNQVIQDFDDFLTQSGKLQWVAVQGGNLGTQGSAANPGQVIINPAMYNSNAGGIFIGSGYNTTPGIACFVLGGGSLSINFVMNLVGLSTEENSYTIYIGLTDAITLYNAEGGFGISPPADGVFFQYTNSVNSGKWQICTFDSSASTTTVNTTVAADATAFHNYGIQINANATSISFSIDGTTISEGPITTNITPNQITPAIYIIANSGTSPESLVDLFYYTQALTTAR